MRHIQLVRSPEQDPMLVFRAALRRERRPRRITRRQSDFKLVLRRFLGLSFGFQPARNVRRERQLSQRLAETLRQIVRDGLAVDRRRLLRGHSAGCSTDGPSLHEFAFERVQRRQLIVPRLQCRQLRPDPEQSSDEIFQVRRELNDQLRLRFVFHRGPRRRCRSPGCQQTMMQIRARAFQVRQKPGVQTRQTRTCIKVLYTWKNDRKTVHEKFAAVRSWRQPKGLFLLRYHATFLLPRRAPRTPPAQRLRNRETLPAAWPGRPSPSWQTISLAAATPPDARSRRRSTLETPPREQSTRRDPHPAESIGTIRAAPSSSGERCRSSRPRASTPKTCQETPPACRATPACQGRCAVARKHPRSASLRRTRSSFQP